MAVSINDVARAAGVSTSTVSRALRQQSGVSDEVRERIVRIAAGLGYVASRHASSLATGRTSTVGVLAPYVGRWSFGQVLDAAEGVFSAAGYDLLLYNVGTATARERFFSRMPASKHVDALMLLIIPTEAEARALRELGIPLGSTVGGPRPGFVTVGIDDHAGARMAVRHLVNLGHRRIGLLGTESTAPMYWTTPLARRQAYLDVLADAGIAYDKALDVDGEYTFAGGERAMTQLLTADVPPTAVFAQSDEMAMGALRALRRHGLRAPQDVSIVGFDDHELAEVVGLTTIAQDVTDQGAELARLLLRRLNAPEAAESENVLMPVQLMVRETTAPPRHRSVP